MVKRTEERIAYDEWIDQKKKVHETYSNGTTLIQLVEIGSKYNLISCCIECGRLLLYTRVAYAVNVWACATPSGCGRISEVGEKVYKNHARYSIFENITSIDSAVLRRWFAIWFDVPESSVEIERSF